MQHILVASPVLARAGIGFVIAIIIALGARRADSLSASGALAAAGIGTISAVAGAGWGVLLVAYFVAASLLSRYGRHEKERLTGGVVAKGGPRDATQVIANGGIFASALAIATFSATDIASTMHVVALGALAASSADTWATEIGTLHGGTPRSLFSLRRVDAGTSGAISAIGSVAMIVGAAFVAVGAVLVGLGASSIIVASGGVAGALFDSLLGATVQDRRWCPTCSTETERGVHGCGTATTHARGVAWIDNDAVNFLSTLIGGAVAALLATL